MDDQYHAYKEAYLKQMKSLSKLGHEEVDYLLPYLQVSFHEKNTFVFEPGDVQTSLCFLLEGLTRRYYINEKGNEITTGFAKENEYVTDYPLFIQQQPTKFYFKCIEACTIVRVPYETIQEAYQIYPSYQVYGRLMAEKVLTILTDRMESFLFSNAEDRYLRFVKKYPDLMNRVSLTHLSTFLGIERQSLSRIRKGLSIK